MEEERLPVRVFLPLRLNQRRGAFVSELWTCEVLKRPDFDISDVDPFFITKTTETDFGVYQKTWPFEVRSVNQAGRNVLLACWPMPYSKAHPLQIALEATGWKRIRRSNSHDWTTAEEQEIVSSEPGA